MRGFHQGEPVGSEEVLGSGPVEHSQIPQIVPVSLSDCHCLRDLNVRLDAIPLSGLCVLVHTCHHHHFIAIMFRLEICQKFYTTRFLGQKFYTLKTETSQLFSHNKCINKIEIECVKLQQFYRKAKSLLVKEQNLWVNIIFVWIICTKTQLARIYMINFNSVNTVMLNG